MATTDVYTVVYTRKGGGDENVQVTATTQANAIAAAKAADSQFLQVVSVTAIQLGIPVGS